LLAPRAVWRRLLSLGTYPPVATCKANTGKTPRFLRFPIPAHRVPLAGRALTRSLPCLICALG
jgi:hypothetical protein